ncbi:hypothetical protein KW805_01495 [Candidatus Pacearchaeota archaeon]|nr:hypothetical protein [Candidatus Pacearchaeota archaeon]
MIKRNISLFFLGFFAFLLLSMSFVSAARSVTFSQAVTNLVNGITSAFDPIFSKLLGTTINAGSDLFAQILIFFLVTLVVYGILSSVNVFGNKPWVNILIGAIIAILGIRFLPSDILEAMTIPSSAFVATIVIVIPFIISGVIIERIQSINIRRALWAIYGVMVLVLWAYAWSETDISGWAIGVYPAILGAIIVAFAFDGTLQRFMHKADSGKRIENITNEERSILLGRIAGLTDALRTAANAAERAKIHKQIADARATLNSL